ncbi:MAG: glycosyltransferase family 2 protein [Pirellulaceae bacterium]|nr:glycosyltransferase family 2 protein [Pirellulaceae bacterium]
MISVLILTKNEELNLPSCLEALQWCDDIVVLDSHSTDRTVEIAKQAGARVFQREFDNERDQRTASLTLDFKYPWIYNPDADEIPSIELIRDMQNVAASDAAQPCAFRVRFKTIFMGQWIRRSSLYPTWAVRFFRKDAVSFERSINLRYVVHGEEGTFQSHFEHHTFRKGIAHWFAKHNRYSDFEAQEGLKANRRQPRFRDILSSKPLIRRSALKEFAFRLPFRPLLRFVYMYFLRLGILDGRAGFHYCVLLSIYEYMISIKMSELRQRKQEVKSESQL